MARALAYSWHTGRGAKLLVRRVGQAELVAHKGSAGDEVAQRLDGKDRSALHHRQAVQKVDESTLFGRAVCLEDPIKVISFDLHQLDGLCCDRSELMHGILLQELVLT